MQEDEMFALINQTAALMEEFKRNVAEIGQERQVLVQQVLAAIQQLPAVNQQSAENALRTLPGQVLNKVQEGMEPPTSRLEERLDMAGGGIEKRFHALAALVGRLEKVAQLLIWKLLGGAIIALALLLIGGVYLSMHYTQEINDNQISAELLKAYNAADVTPCGNAQLCANVDLKSQRYGDSKKQYLPIKPR